MLTLLVRACQPYIFTHNIFREMAVALFHFPHIFHVYFIDNLDEKLPLITSAELAIPPAAEPNNTSSDVKRDLFVTETANAHIFLRLSNRRGRDKLKMGTGHLLSMGLVAG